VPREYLVAYLSSPQAEQDFPRYGVIPHIRPIELASIIIPAVDSDFDSIRLASMRLGEGSEEASRIQRDLHESRIRIFEGKSSSDRRLRLEQAADLSSLIAQNLRKQNEPYKAFQETYPYAAARAVRKLKHSLILGERHEAAIQCAESLILTLGIFSLALAAHAGRQDLAEITEWAESVRKGGVSLGQWVGVIRAVGADARERGDSAAGLADATALQRGGKGLMADLNSLVALRNDIRHGGGPRTRAEVERTLEKLEALVSNGLSSSAFLARSEWVYTDRLRWLPEIGKYQISGLSLMGDHPDFEAAEFKTDLPLADENLYLRTPQGIIPLSPFCILSDCRTCLAPELYYPDRLARSTALLKSLDRGHELENDMVFTRLVSMYYS
jgi:type I restriction enzyme M protein